MNGLNFFNERTCQWTWMGPFTSFGNLSMSLMGPFACVKKTAHELEWAHSLPSRKLPIIWMGPFEHMRKFSDELEWAQYVQWEKLPMSLIGPIPMHEQNHPMTRMGPVCSMRETVNVLEWAHSHAWRKLPMTAIGPNMSNERNCHRLGWALHVQWEKLPIEEAHFLAQRSLSMTRNGPILLHNLTRRLHWMGPFSCMKKTADVTNEPIWEKLPMTHSLTWETANELELSHSHAGTKLPMSTNGPIL